MARQHQAQQGLTEEFPPLGGLGVGTIGHQQRSRLGQDPMTNPDATGTGGSRASADTQSQFSNDRKTSSQETSSRGELEFGLESLLLC